MLIDVNQGFFRN